MSRSLVGMARRAVRFVGFVRAWRRGKSGAPRRCAPTTGTLACRAVRLLVPEAWFAPGKFCQTLTGSAGPGPSPNPIKQMLLDTSHSNSGTEQIIIIPISNSGCTGSSSTITVTVNPTPVVTNSAKETISSGTDTNINLTSSVPSSFTWTIGTITGNITGASPGSGVSINQILTNPSSTATGTVQYIITPTSVIGFCPGPSYTITVTVNPHT